MIANAKPTDLIHPLGERPHLQQVLWLYILEHGPGTYSSAKLAKHLHARQPNVHSALKALIADGHLRVLDQPSPGRAGAYKAVPPPQQS